MEICVYVCILLLEEVLEVWCSGRCYMQREIGKTWDRKGTHTHTCAFTHTCVFTHMLVHAHMCFHTCTYMYTHTSTCALTHIHTCAFTYMCFHTHTYIPTYCAYIAVYSATQSCPTLVTQGPNPARGIFQARRLEWVTDSFSKGSSHLRDQTCVCLLCLLNFRWILYPLSQYMYIKFLN